MKINNKIRDIEDSDCYFEGNVTKLHKDGSIDKYLVTRIIWNGEEDFDSELLGKQISLAWSYTELR